MKNHKILLALLSALLLALTAGCSVDDPTDASDQVNAPGLEDAGAQYTAIGNSLTAGYMDAGLMLAGQQNSYPQLIASKLGLGSMEFTQPFVAPPGLGSSGASEGHVAGVLYYDGLQPTKLGETPFANIPDLLLAAAIPTPYNNLGVPAARLAEARSTYSMATSFGGGNLFFDVVNRSDKLFGNITVPADATTGFPAYESASQFWQAIASGPALLTLWLGANDVLFAGFTGEPMSYPYVTDPMDFAAEFQVLLPSLAGGLQQRNGRSSTIVVGTVPKISNAAYFLPAANFAAVAPALGNPGFDESEVEYVLLLDFLAWEGFGTGADLPPELTLDTDEVAFLDGTIDAYNAAIVGTVGAINGMGLARCGIYDSNVALEALTAEQRLHFMYLRMIHPTEPIAETAARTYFSLDGVHPNNVGYAYVANGFMEEIEATDDTYDFGDPLPLAAFTWDPTYAAYGGGVVTKATGPQRISQEVVDGIKALYR